MSSPAICKCGRDIEQHEIYVGRSIKEATARCKGYAPLMIIGLPVIAEEKLIKPKKSVSGD